MGRYEAPIRPMPRVRRVLCGLLATVLMCVVARGDLLHLRGGGRVEGKITAESPTAVTVETPFGVQTIPRTRILKIERKESPAEAIKRREAALAADDAQGHYRLALFAREHHFKKIYKRLLEKTVAIDPDHEEANRALGHVRYQGRWVRAEEQARAQREDRVNRMRALGLVEYQGRWVTPEEKENLEKGMIRHDGQWLSEEEARRAQGLERYGESWVTAEELVGLRERDRVQKIVDHPLQVASRTHLIVVTDYPEEDTRRLALQAEEAAQRLIRELGHAPDDLEWLGGRPVFLIVFRARAAYEAYVTHFAALEPKVDDVWARQVKQNYGFYWWDPVCTSVAYQGPRRRGSAVGHTLHNLGHLLLNRHLYNFKYLPAWLDEGFAALFESEVHDRNDVFCVGRLGYSNGGRRDRFEVRADWRGALRRAMESRQDLPVEALVRRDLNGLGELEIAKAMASVAYLRSQRHEGWLKLLAQLRERWPEGRPMARTQACIEAHTQAFREALGCDAAALEAAIRDWFPESASATGTESESGDGDGGGDRMRIGDGIGDGGGSGCGIGVGGGSGCGIGGGGVR